MTLLKEKVITTCGDWHTIDYNNKEVGRLNLITTLVEILERKNEERKIRVGEDAGRARTNLAQHRA